MNRIYTKLVFLLVFLINAVPVFGQSPSISSFSPLATTIGSNLTINGSSFSATAANNKVTFGGIAATVSSATISRLVVQVPAGASFGKIEIRVGTLLGHSIKDFDVRDANPCAGNTLASIPPSPYAALAGSRGISTSDLNGDGILDLVTANQTTNNISVLLGTGPGTFGAQTSYATGTGPVGVALGDFNGDGKVDIASSNYTAGTLSVLTGSGTGSFTLIGTLTVGANPYNVICGDFSGDGKLDLVSVNYGSTSISVLLGNGNGTFAVAVPYTTGTFPGQLAKGDFDGDGKYDIAVTNVTSNTVSIFKNQGSGTFNAKQDIVLGFQPRGVAVGDFNGDAYQDMVISDNTNNRIAFLNSTGANAYNITYLPCGVNPWYVTVFDFNGDGNQDAAIANVTDQTVSIYTGNGGGVFTFVQNVPTGTGPYGIAVGDFEKNGKQDLAVVNNTSNDISVLLNSCPPSITSFSPSSGPIGSLITITGTDLTYATGISIGGSSSIVLSYSTTQIVGFVMPGATTGLVTVSTPGGFATSTSNFTITPTGYPCTQQGAKLVGTGNVGAAQQAISVSVSADGSTAVVGGNNDNPNQGAVWFYIRSGSGWVQQGSKLVGTGNIGAANQGISVSISADGNTAIVGGHTDNTNVGATWVFTRTAGVWTQQGLKLVGTGAVGTSRQGRSVSISADGNTAIVGGWGDNSNQGAAWIFVRNGANWTQQGAKLVGTGSVGSAQQGYTVSLSADGNTAIVGGNLDNSNQGAVWVYTRAGGVWTQQGSKLVGTGNVGAANQGTSVSLSADGNTAMVGGVLDNATVGGVWIFKRSGGVWSQEGSKLVGTGNTGTSQQGVYVSLSADGNTGVFGGDIDNGGIGAAWVFTRSAGVWTQRGGKLVGTGNVGASAQGRSVSLSADGNILFLGGKDDNSSQGAAWIFVSSIPTINSFLPTSGSIGSVITLSGSNFSGISSVSFGGITASSFTLVNSTTITAVVGSGASGVVSVVSNCGTATLGGFTFFNSPIVITSLSTVAANIGSVVTISGFGFNATNNAVFVGTRRAPIQSQSSSTIVIKVPCGSQSDFVTVVNLGNGLAAKSTQKFSTTFTASPLSASSFRSPVDLSVGGAIYHNKLADLNNDGFLDLIVSGGGGTLSIYQNSQSPMVNAGTYSTLVQITGGVKFVSSEAADFDGDGKLDIVAADQSSATKVYRNTSPSTTNISFSGAVSLTTSNSTAVAVADLDKDGKLDVVVVQYTTNPPIKFFKNTSTIGAISFAAGVTIGATAQSHDVDLADWDGDGAEDVLVSDEGTSVVNIYQNVGNASSFPLGVSLTIPTAYNIDLGDFNNDGKIDFASARGGQRICLNTSPAPGTFSGNVVSTPVSGSFGIDMNDLDGDNKLDLSYFNGSNISAARNLGGTAGTSFNITAYSGTNFNMTSGDLNCDTYPELIASNISNSFSRIIPNLPPISLTSFTPSSGSVGNVVTLSGSNFVSVSSVSFGGITASSFVVVNSTTITAVVGNGASGVVVVNSSTLGTASLAGFTFTAPGAALDFDGSNDYVDINPVIPYTNDFTLEAWIKTTQSNGVVYAWGSPVVNNFVTMGVYFGYLRLAIGDGSIQYIDGVTLINTNSWTHIAITKTGSSIKLYVNGNLDATSTYSNVPTPSSSSIGAGLLNNIIQSYYMGQIDEVRVWNRGLCQAEIQNNRNCDNLANQAGLIAQYSFNQGNASLANPTVTSLLDKSVNLYTGTLTNFALTSTVSNWVYPGGIISGATCAGYATNTATISSFSPSSGATGSVITLTGSNFTGVTAVYFGGLPALSFSIVSATKITAVVGAGSSGAISINPICGAATLGGFSYLSPPSITSFSPVSGSVGSQVTILGSGFSSTLNNNKVSFGGIAASVISATTSQLTVLVPAGAAYNNITVETNGLVAVSTSAFDVMGTCTGLSSFGTKTDYATGTYPNAVTVGDFNGDGKQDLALANSGNNTVSVLLGLGSGLFGIKTDYPTGTNPSSVAVGDFNGDGKQDLAISNYVSNTISVLLGTGSGTFGAKTDYPTGAGPFSVAIGDFNGDGKQDLATANYGTNTISVLLGIGGGNFGGYINYTTQSSPHSIAVGDFNNDGKQDLAVVGDATNTVSVHQGNGAGAFVLIGSYPVGSGGFSVAVGEFNGDGNQDLAVINANSNSISVLQGSGLGTFGIQAQYGVGLSPNLVTIGDFNGDGKQDLVSANYDSDSISVLLGTGSGIFGSRKDYSTGTSPVSIAVGDFNGDGMQDLVTANNNAASASLLLNSCILPTPIATPKGNLGLYFNGSNTFNYNSLLTSQTNNITIEAWVKPKSAPSSTATIFYIGKPSFNGYGLFLDNNLNVQYLAGGFPPAMPVNYTLEPNKWTHLALVIESGFVKVYANGVLLPFSDSNVPNVPTLGLSAGDLFIGQLDEMRVYNSALSAIQIISDMSSQSTSTELAYWNMDDDLGTPGSTSSNDQSGAGYDVDISDPVASPIWAYRVTNTLDDGSVGSLRWVINYTNLKLNTNYIDFSIQQSSTSIVSTIPIGSQIAINNPVILDGYSAYGSYPNTNPLTSGLNTQLRVELNMAGMGSFPDVTGVEITNVDNSVVRGLSIYGIADSGGGRQAMNFINGNNNTVSGCWFGIMADGTSSFNMNGIYFINGNSNVIGYAGNVPDVSTFNIISNCGYQGIAISDNNSIFQGNYIGYGPDGITPAWIGYWGMPLGGSGNIIKNNLIGYSGQYIMRVGGSNSLIQGNMIGIDLNGTQTIENANGIYIFSGTNNTIGGINPGESNIIANGNDYGIRIDGSGVVGHIISGNSIFWNTSGGIGLVNGGNNDKPAPTITSAYTNAVSGTTSQSGDIIQIFYDSPQFGTTDQGRIYLGQTTAIGTNWSFTATLTTGSRITATATDGVNGTSPFSSAQTVVNYVPPKQPLGNRGMYFDGIDDQVATGNVISLNDFTIEFWLKTKDTGGSLGNWYDGLGLVDADASGSNPDYGVNFAAGKILFGIAGGTTYSESTLVSNSTVNDGAWHHIAATRVNNTGLMKIYIDGVLDATLTATVLNQTVGIVPISIGRVFSNTAYFNGQLDEIKVFNAARSISEIQADMGSTISGAAGLVSYWDFEDDASVGNQTIANDVSGNGNAGTLTNGPLWSLRVTDNTDNASAGLGSLRQAINDANSDTDQDYIDFSLPSGTQTIQPTITYTLSYPILIDGFSQLNTIPGENSMANTNAFGQPINAKLNVVINGVNAGSNDAFLLANSDAEIKGLVVNGFSSSAAFNFSNIQPNVNNNKISGCFIGTDRDGTTAVSNNYGFQASAPLFIRYNNTIGGINQADRNLISGNAKGIADLDGWNNGLIQNNYIGTNATGSGALPNFGAGGIHQILNSFNNIIASNVISGNSQDGIQIISASSGNHVIRGNRIGTTADGQSSLPNGANGVTIFNNSNNTVGGLGIGDANIIANNGLNGVSIQFYGVNNIVLNNAIYDNASSGIYLIDYGNNGKAAPVIVNAFTDKVYGTCQSGDLVEVFYDSPQFGTTDQGRVYIGQATTIGTNWSFAATLTVGSRITATGTDGVNGTSPFSAAATVTSAVAAASLDFDGVDDYVDIPNNAFLNSLPMTVECWVKTTSTNLCYEGLVNKYYASSFNGWSLFKVNNLVYAYYYVSPSDFIAFPSNGTIPINDGSWHHIAMVVEATGGKLYIDGALSGSGAWIGTPSTCTTLQNLSIGSYPGNIQTGCTGGTPGFYNGSMDEVRIWNRALCQSEITNNLNCEKPGDLTGLIAKYDFNQGFAGASNPLETSLVDSSGNGNIGTLYNFGLSGNSSNWILSSPITTGSVCIPFTKPVISVTGNANLITNGSLTPTTLEGTDFGLASGVVTRNFTIKNSGVSPLTISSIYLGNGIDFNTPVIALAPVIAVGDTLQFSVTYFYNGGNSIDTVKITSDDCSTPLYSFVIQASTPGAALDFDGLDDVVDLPIASALDFPGTGDFTIETWVKTDANNSASIIGGGGGCNTNQMGVTVAYGKVNFFIDYVCATGAHIVTTQNVVTNPSTWYHIACVYTGNGDKLIYVNGVLQATTENGLKTNAWTSSNNIWRLGQTNGAYNGLGIGSVPTVLDEFRMWNRALCQAEIANNMNAEVPGNSSGLVIRYDFNQGLANSNNLGIGILTDASGNGYDGTLNNFTLSGVHSNWVTPGGVLMGSTTTSVNCIRGAALNFYGSNNYVSTNLWSTSLKNITMEASVYWNGTTGVNQQIMLNGNSGSNGYGITIQGGAGGDALSILQGGSAWISSSVVLSTNSWHHIAAVNDNGTWSLYLDGTPLSIVFNTAIPNSIAGVSNSFIGSNQLGQENFNGTIDNVRFWDRPLCQAEVNAHLGCERPLNTAGLLARYDFNEGYSGGINTSVTTLVDSSGNGNTGTLTGFGLSNSVSNWVSPGAVISGSTCSGISVPVGSTWTWVGGNSSDWFSPCNWDKRAIPDATSDVVIPGGTTFAPTITGSTAYCNTILINTDNGGIVNLDSSGGGVLNVTQ